MPFRRPVNSNKSDTAPKRHTPAIRLEQLEPRCVPARFEWFNAAGVDNDNWSYAPNWLKEFGPGLWFSVDDYPGKDGRIDDVVRIDDRNTPGNNRETKCVLNVPVTLKRLEVGEHFARDFGLQETLTIKDGELKLLSENTVLRGNADLRQIKLDKSTCTWYAGVLWNLRVIAGMGRWFTSPSAAPLVPTTLTPWGCTRHTSTSSAAGSSIGSGGTSEPGWQPAPHAGISFTSLREGRSSFGATRTSGETRRVRSSFATRARSQSEPTSPAPSKT